MNRPINIPSGTKYLSEALSELPKDCLFNKGRIGGGGTTLALTDEHPTVICVPTVALIHNKVTQVNENKKGLYDNRNALGICGHMEKVSGNLLAQIQACIDASDFNKHIGDYIASCKAEGKPPKILVTYNSLPKVAACINPQDFNLLVDEYHMLFTEYSYRHEAAWAVLDNFEKFHKFTFMTSTPIEEQFVLKELKPLDIVNAEWEDKTEINISPICCEGKGKGVGSIHQTVSNTIKNCLAGGYGDTNLYIFVNEIKFINGLIKQNKLGRENCRVIYSMSNNTAVLANGIERGTTLDAPKRINFLTSTAFEGTDIEDENGWTIIVSDGANAHTLVDIHTKLPQIAGRIRNTKIQGITHIYKTTLYHNKKDESRFLKELNEKINYEKKLIEGLANKEAKDNAFNSKNFNKILFHRYQEETGKISFDENRVNISKWNWNLANNVYNLSVNVANAYSKSNHTFSNHVYYDGVDYFKQAVEELNKRHVHVEKSNCNCMGTMEEYETALEMYNYYKAAAFKAYPVLEKVWEKFGYEWIENKKFRQDNIQAYLDKQVISEDTTTKLAKAISHEFEIGSTTPLNEAKERMKKIYTDLGIVKKPVVTHLDEFFKITIKAVRINGAPPVKAVIIHSSKVNLKAA